MKLRTLFSTALLAFTVSAEAGGETTKAPLYWGERETLYTTVCEKRWHVVRVKALRNHAIDKGEGVLQQAKREKEAHFAGQARCFTGHVTHWPVDNADIIEGVKSWVRIEDAKGPVPCFDGKQCRWEIHVVRFVESNIELPDGSGGGPVYVATERSIVARRLVPGRAK